MARRRGGLNPDTQTVISLEAAAERHAREHTDHDRAVDDLRTIAGGRPDLVARAAGSLLGAFIADPFRNQHEHVKPAALLLDVGFDGDLLVPELDRVRYNAAHGSHGMPTPPEPRRSMPDPWEQTGQAPTDR